MNVAIVGCGNVGSNLLHHLVSHAGVARLFAIDIQPGIAEAALLDLAGYKPREANRVTLADNSVLSDCDVVVITAGYKSVEGESRSTEVHQNLSIVKKILSNVELRPSAIVISIPGPVETITAGIQQACSLPARQVIGFGGDLDRNRLLYLLNEREIAWEGVHVIGEHGHRAIPVMDNEKEYDEIALDLRTFLSRIARMSGVKRNLATAPLLAKLVVSILEDRREIHYVAGLHPDYAIFLTWPFSIAETGIFEPLEIQLPSKAAANLEQLVLDRRREEAHLPSWWLEA